MIKFRFYSLISFLFCLSGYSTTGYYVGLSGNLNRYIITPELTQNVFSGFNEKFKENRLGATFMAGYMYSLPKFFSLAGQVYFGLGGKELELHKNWTYNSSSKNYTFTSNFELRNRYYFGAEVLGGITLSNILIYGLLGYQVRVMQTKGNIQALQDNEKMILFFGKSSQTIQGIDFPQIKPLHKFPSSLTLGIGGRIYLLKKFFIGIEGRYSIPKKHTLKTKYSLYDPHGIFGHTSTTTSEAKDKIDVKIKLKSLGVSVIIGGKL